MMLSWVELVKVHFRLTKPAVKMDSQLGFLKVSSCQTHENSQSSYYFLAFPCSFTAANTVIYLACLLKVLSRPQTMVALLVSEQR